MTTLHIENTVRDYASWQEAFDKFERFRADNGVTSYRICRQAGDPNQITVDLEFGSTAEAEAFVPLLRADLEHTAVPRAAGRPRSARGDGAAASSGSRGEPASP